MYLTPAWASVTIDWKGSQKQRTARHMTSQSPYLIHGEAFHFLGISTSTHVAQSLRRTSMMVGGATSRSHPMVAYSAGNKPPWSMPAPFTPMRALAVRAIMRLVVKLIYLDTTRALHTQSRPHDAPRSLILRSLQLLRSWPT